MEVKYQAIIRHILEKIENGSYKRGQKLPSIRQLSKAFACSKDTVQKAFLELKYQNIIYAVEKSGYYVLEDKEFQNGTFALKKEELEHLSYDDFRICLHESLIGREDYLFNYYHQQEGLEELIASSQRLLAETQVFCKKEQLVITSGTQQALYILSQMTFPNNQKEILIETPTYHRMKEMLDQRQLSYLEIERTITGIDLRELEKIFQTGTIKFFYTIPRLHNPLGTSLCLEQQKEIIRLATKYQVYIVEDDYMAELDVNQIIPLHYLDTENRVIYLKSFTPTLFPALRIGCVCLPDMLVQPFLQDKRLIDYDTNLIMQKALSLYIDNGMFHRKTQSLRDATLKQLLHLQQLCAEKAFPYPHALTQHGLVLQMPLSDLTPQLKHSKLPLKWITSNSWLYLLLPNNPSFANALPHLLTLLDKKKKS